MDTYMTASLIVLTFSLTGFFVSLKEYKKYKNGKR